MAAKMDFATFKTKMLSLYGNMNLTDDHLKVVFQYYLDSPQADDGLAWYRFVFVQD